MQITDLPPELIARVARHLDEPSRDRLVSVAKFCAQAVKEARIVDIYDDVKRPERTNKELLPLPRELIKAGGHDYVYGNILKSLSHLNPPATRGPLWRFYEGGHDLFQRCPRKPKNVFLGFDQAGGAAQGFGRWFRSDTWGLGTLIGGRACGFAALNGPKRRVFKFYEQGCATGYGLVMETGGRILEGDFKHRQLHGLGKITSREGQVQQGLFLNGILCPAAKACSG